MNIGGAGFNRFGDDLVDETDHRRFAGKVPQSLDIMLECSVGGGISLLSVTSARSVISAIEPVNRVVDLALDSDPRQDRLSSPQADDVTRELVGGIGHHHNDAF